MKLAVLRERDPGEARVAATPDTIKRYRGLGLDVSVEAAAGIGSGIPDGEFEAAGARVEGTMEAVVSGAEAILAVRRPTPSALAGCRPGAVVLALMDPFGNEAALA